MSSANVSLVCFAATDVLSTFELASIVLILLRRARARARRAARVFSRVNHLLWRMESSKRNLTGEAAIFLFSPRFC